MAYNLSQATTLFELVFNESMNFENFDFESTCFWNGTATHDHNDKQCCGEYPTRYFEEFSWNSLTRLEPVKLILRTPYHHQNNSRACCGGSIIKTDTHCCVDDQALLGSDPSCPVVWKFLWTCIYSENAITIYMIINFVKFFVPNKINISSL